MEIANLCTTSVTDVYNLVHPELKGTVERFLQRDENRSTDIALG